ncbi:o-succinylbenzoate synthase [Salibacteraceae bacterium]|nr:o-succinylbenzoate synthase [Salibacteraceae bacterium]
MTEVFWKKYTLNFKKPSGTSRGVLLEKHSYFFIAKNLDFPYPVLGECSLIEGLSPDPVDGYEEKLTKVCDWLNKKTADKPDLSLYPSIEFGLETFEADLKAKGNKIFYNDGFTKGEDAMLINGLVWMGGPKFMLDQVQEKITQGFTCVKLKIGAIDFQEELNILKQIRNQFGNDLELRVDANGAFSADEALSKLEALSAFKIHSIEQPIKPGQWREMAQLCQETPIPIALDEELISVIDFGQKTELLDTVKPQFIILKPSLLGGLNASNQWIQLAEERSIAWWMTSALESNVGLNSITQFTFSKNVNLPQGLGTGSLYLNNFESPLYIQGEMIKFDPDNSWNLNNLIL